jgi:hypothetical protein
MRLIANNLVLSATITPSTESPFFPIENLQNQLRSKRFRTTSKSTQNIVFDFGSAKAVNSFIMLLPKEGVINLTESATIKIQANATNSWGAPSVDQTLTYDSDFRQLTYFWTSDQTYRYWRLTVSDASAASDYVEISKIILGDSVDIPGIQNGFGFDKVDGTKKLSNDYGTGYFDEYPILKSMKFKWKTLTVSEIEILDQLFEVYGSFTGMFLTLDQTSTVFNKDRYSIYGTLSPSHSMNHINYNLLDSDGFTFMELN